MSTRQCLSVEFKGKLALEARRLTRKIEVVEAMLVLFALCLSFLPVSSYAADYTIERHKDGPFATRVYAYGQINQGSSLTRESILLNDPTCPIQIRHHTTTFGYRDRGPSFVADTAVEFIKPIVAYKVTVMLYDVFGAHMSNLVNTDVKDFKPSEAKLHAEWRASDRDLVSLLTTVTFVKQERLADGSQWRFNAKSLAAALAKLNLEENLVDEKKGH